MTHSAEEQIEMKQNVRHALDKASGLAPSKRPTPACRGEVSPCPRSVYRTLLALFVLATTQRGWSAEIDFSHQVVPILQKHCVGCHGGKEAKGGLSINSRELLLEAEVVKLESIDESPLLQRLRSNDPEEQMPPPDRPRLSADEIEIITRWLREGVTWEAGFSFADERYEPPLLPRRPEIPAAIHEGELPLDRFVRVYFESHHVTSPLPLDDRQFLRRVTLDLTGLLPTPEQTISFVQDSAPDKRSRVIDQLLADNDSYATHWLTFWNDLLRNAYAGTGYIDGGRSSITSWLYRALHENRPYDQFVRELIAPAPDAAGFVQGIKWRGNVNASQTREIQFAQSVSQVFLGINMKCASCHDSFIDRWKLHETYGLAAIFAQEPLEIHRCDKAQGTKATAAWIFPELGQVDPRAPQPARLQQLASLMTHPQNGRLTRTMVNRLWERMMGRGLVHPVDAMHTRPWSDDVLDYLSVDFADHQYDVKHVLRTIANSRAYQSTVRLDTTIATADEYVFRGPHAKRLTAEQFVDGLAQLTQHWPTPVADHFARDGRNQRGQLRDVLIATSTGAEVAKKSAEELRALWGTRALRAAFTDLDTLQAGLGRPNREQIVSTRPLELTTLQAIQLANGPELATMLSEGAKQLAPGSLDAPDALIDRVFQVALTRLPTDDERQAARDLLSNDGIPTTQRVEDLLWMVVMLPEFQLIQ